MKRIVILGSSAVGVKVIEELRAKNTEDRITIISFDGHYPYCRDAFASFISKDISAEEVFCRAKDFYEKNNVKMILENKIARINFKKQTIFMEDKERIEYDILIISDTPENKYPEIKGTNKAGVYGYKKLKDIDQLTGVVPLIDTVGVQTDSFTGLAAVAALLRRGKEVILVSSRKGFLTTHFKEDAARLIISKFEHANCQVMLDDKIDEVLGDKDAKAIRIKDGKVYSTQAILFTETAEDLRLFADSGLQMEEGINVNEQFQTNVAGVFAVDQVCTLANSEPVTVTSVLNEQANNVVAAIGEQQRSFEVPPTNLSLSFEGLTMTVLGQTDIERGIELHQTLNEEAGTYKGLYLNGNQLVGAVLVNAESEKEALLKIITEKGAVELVSAEQNAEQADEESISTELVDN